MSGGDVPLADVVPTDVLHECADPQPSVVPSQAPCRPLSSLRPPTEQDRWLGRGSQPKTVALHWYMCQLDQQLDGLYRDLLNAATEAA
eukprot:549406-Alexandrium_andersonii.AAC.1